MLRPRNGCGRSRAWTSCGCGCQRWGPWGSSFWPTWASSSCGSFSPTFLLAFAPFILGLAFRFRKRAREAYSAARRVLAQINAYIAESLSGMGIIQLFRQEKRSLDTFFGINLEFFRARMRSITVYGVFGPVISVMQNVALALLVWYGGRGVVFTLGALVGVHELRPDAVPADGEPLRATQHPPGGDGRCGADLVKERGERQLLFLARAVAADPKFIVLDEATANIDSQTEAQVQQALERVLAGRTSIAIAHRLSTIRNADRVLVIHEGKLVEEGTAAELLDKKGLFWALWQLQFAGDGNVPAPLNQATYLLTGAAAAAQKGRQISSAGPGPRWARPYGTGPATPQARP